MLASTSRPSACAAAAAFVVPCASPCAANRWWWAHAIVLIAARRPEPPLSSTRIGRARPLPRPGQARVFKGRSFCPACGSRVFHLSEAIAEVMIGAFDDAPGDLRPARPVKDGQFAGNTGWRP